MCLWLAIASVVVIIALVGCSGDGVVCPVSGTLFVGNMHSDAAVGIYDGVTGDNGEVEPDRMVVGAATELQHLEWTGMCAVRATDDVYVCDQDAQAVFVFSPASTVNGNVAPVRTLQGPATWLTQPYGVQVDAGRDILYVCDPARREIHVWDNASTVDGDVGPDRNIDMGGEWCSDIALDAGNDRLYVQGGREIFILENASDQHGPVVIDREISGPGWDVAGSRGLTVDPGRDRLYTVIRDDERILVFNNLDTIDGPTAPLHIIEGGNTGMNAPLEVEIDRIHNHLYQLNDTGREDIIQVWHNASTVDGNAAPNRVIEDPTGTLSRMVSLSYMPD
jgi:DNA-binding beta-propeller fold protein YncE